MPLCQFNTQTQKTAKRSAVRFLTPIRSSETSSPMNKSNEEEERFLIRKLEVSDKSKGFLELLRQLTSCGPISEEKFQNRFNELNSDGDDHVVFVIEDKSSAKIVATGTLLIEKKFIRNCGSAGHMEDIVVDSSVRGMQLGKKIVDFLTDIARSKGCYKVILDCSAENTGFYEKCGYKQKEIQMVKYFN